MHDRHSRTGVTSRLRLRGHDYAAPCMYLVTICAEHRTCRFGDIRDDQVNLNAAGEIIIQRWDELPKRFTNIDLDAAVLMPNHLHGIVSITGDPLATEFDPKSGLSRAIQAFKSMTTVDYGRGVRQMGWPPYQGRLWQEGFHDYIIRSDGELDRVRDYIEANPSSWPQDDLFVAPVFRPITPPNLPG